MAACMSAFDAIASSYDRLWTESTVGAMQRRAVWKVMDALFASGDTILDLGCGTGADALHLQERGIRVRGIDSSLGMVSIARKKGVNAVHYDLKDLPALSGRFDGVISNFGALNCLQEMTPVAGELGRLVRPGGFVALCFLGRFCLWETGYYLLNGEARKAVRRFSGRAQSSYGLDIFYPSERALLRPFRQNFLLVARRGIGFAVPPSYIKFVRPSILEKLAALDSRVATWPLLRSLADHRLYVWQRI
jgi:ubiquinone/menaquinone biosynthesis C-methylase UbiE